MEAIHPPQPGSPPVLLLLHGFPLDPRMWRGQKPLASRIRVLAPAFPGFGSEPPPPRPGLLSAYAEAARCALDRAGAVRAVVCGFSMGGYVAFELWRSAPGRIAALILCSTRAEAETPEGRAGREEGIRRIETGGAREFVSAFGVRLLAPRSLYRPEITGSLREILETQQDTGLLPAVEAMRDRPDSVPTLKTIGVPTLVVAGREDQITPPAAAAEMARQITEAELALIPGCGHLVPMEDSGSFNRTVGAFLDRIR